MRTAMLEPSRWLSERVASAVEGYEGGDKMPIGGYAVLLGGYVTLLAAGLALVHDKLPRRFRLGDVVLMGIATHKIARTATKDFVTSPLRAPFVHFERGAGAGEVSERSRGRGLRRAVGDLMTCPWCSAPWVAGALLLGFAAAPRVTRTLAALFTAVSISDVLNQSYGALKERVGARRLLSDRT